MQADLETEGYEVQAVLLPASGVNAPHQRERAWFVAHANGAEQANNRGKNIEEKGEIRGNETRNVFRKLPGNGNASNSNRSRLKTQQAQNRRMGNTSRKKAFSGKRSRSIYSRKGWETFPTQPPICGGDDGLPSKLDGITFPKWRNQSIMAYGNAIVPQVAYQIFKALVKTEMNK